MMHKQMPFPFGKTGLVAAALALTVIIMMGCGPAAASPTDEPTEAPSAEVEATDAPEPTETPAPTDTPLPTDTPPPTITPTPAPTAIGGGSGWIVFQSAHEGNTEIYLTNIDGAEPINLTNNPARDEFPHLSPDGTQIMFHSERLGTETFELFVMDLDGGNVQQITEDGGYKANATWSPDGTQILFEYGGPNTGINVMASDGTGMTELVNSEDREWEPSWSPDGTQIAFIRRINNMGDIFTMDIATGTVTQLTNTPANDDRGPVWSPDGTKIAFSTYTGQIGEIFIIDANGENLTQLTPSDDQFDYVPRWSDDGAWILYRSTNVLSEVDLFRINLETKEIINITNTPTLPEDRLDW